MARGFLRQLQCSLKSELLFSVLCCIGSHLLLQLHLPQSDSQSHYAEQKQKLPLPLPLFKRERIFQKAQIRFYLRVTI